jgi:hypothetical protein
MTDPATVFLLVTWLANGKPPDSYQIEFPTALACETARSELAGREKAISQWVADRKAELAAEGTNTNLYRAYAAAETVQTFGGMCQPFEPDKRHPATVGNMRRRVQ